MGKGAAINKSTVTAKLGQFKRSPLRRAPSVDLPFKKHWRNSITFKDRCSSLPYLGVVSSKHRTRVNAPEILGYIFGFLAIQVGVEQVTSAVKEVAHGHSRTEKMAWYQPTNMHEKQKIKPPSPNKNKFKPNLKNISKNYYLIAKIPCGWQNGPQWHAPSGTSLMIRHKGQHRWDPSPCGPRSLDSALDCWPVMATSMHCKDQGVIQPVLINNDYLSLIVNDYWV